MMHSCIWFWSTLDMMHLCMWVNPRCEAFVHMVLVNYRYDAFVHVCRMTYACNMLRCNLNWLSASQLAACFSTSCILLN